MPDKSKFIITPKGETSVTLTVRIYAEVNQKLEMLSRDSNRSKNELINKALSYAFDNLELK